MTPCTHPKLRRSLLNGYDVMCGACGEEIGRVALFPCAVISPLEAAELVAVLPADLTYVGEEGRRSLRRAVVQGGLV